ncbi:MAG: hypothetical protein E7600_00850 [Ruminococcaceae bacterium]|nr:hypothetical protein [Oscillospiraceae bacterium]
MKFSTLRKALILLALVIAVAIPAAAYTGTGTSADPYVITSAEELKLMNNSSAYFKLGADIVINDVNDFTFEDGVITEANGAEAWTPIENFTGTLDGAKATANTYVSYYITGLYVTEDSANGGLFATLNGATVKNVNFDFALVESDEYAGVIAGKAEGTTTITNCIASGSVIGKTTKAMNTAGGLVGCLGTDATISTCASYVTVTGATSYSANVGGVVGLNRGTLTNNGYYGNVYGTATYYDASIGGIAGYNTGNINNCRVAGTIGGESTALVNDCYVGGVVGLNKGSIVNCENGATVSVENFSSGDSICAAGGIAGATIDADIANDTNNGAVTGEYAYVGGIAGVAVSDSGEMTVSACDNTGAVTSTYGVAGGIVGRAAAAGEGYVSIKLNITNCYNTGALNGNATGDLAGETANVESATVNVGAEASAANANTCSAPAIYKIVADKEQYGTEPTATTELVSGTGRLTTRQSAGTEKDSVKIIRYIRRAYTAFIPAPVVVNLTVVSDATKVEILDVDASGLSYADGRITGNVVVEVYRPDTTEYDVVLGTSAGNKFADVDFADLAGSDRVTRVTVPVDCLADAGTITVNAMVVDNKDAMYPQCENMKVSK